MVSLEKVSQVREVIPVHLMDEAESVRTYCPPKTDTTSTVDILVKQPDKKELPAVIKRDRGKEENTTKKSKLSALKDWLDDILPVFGAVFVAAVVICMLTFPLLFGPTDTTQATVTAVGYKGVTVEYKSEYGQDVIKKINVDDASGYQIGDTVTIEIKDRFFVKIVK